MLPMYLHSKEPLRHRARLKKWLKVRCLFAHPEEGTVEPRRQHQMPLVKLGVNEGGQSWTTRETVQAQSLPSKWEEGQVGSNTFEGLSVVGQLG